MISRRYLLYLVILLVSNCILLLAAQLVALQLQATPPNPTENPDTIPYDSNCIVNNTTLVIGGSRGIGKQIVHSILAMSTEGCVVYTSTTHRGRINKTNNPRLFHTVLNITDESSRVRFLHMLRNHFPKGIATVFINAGVFVGNVNVSVKTNFLGPYHITEGLVAMYAPSDKYRMRFIFTSSSAAQLKFQRKFKEFHSFATNVTTVEDLVSHAQRYLRGNLTIPYALPYTVSKVYLNCYVRLMSRRFSGRVVAFNAFNPGHTRTDMTGNKGLYTVEQSVQPALKLALLPLMSNNTGLFFSHDHGNVFKIKW
eukprot:PhF_6_TR44496/c0_g1_i1/m.68530/K00079/CBR1; carbonyl reductase 1